jgi:hypothetical protein
MRTKDNAAHDRLNTECSMDIDAALRRSSEDSVYPLDGTRSYFRQQNVAGFWKEFSSYFFPVFYFTSILPAFSLLSA